MPFVIVGSDIANTGSVDRSVASGGACKALVGSRTGAVAAVRVTFEDCQKETAETPVDLLAQVGDDDMLVAGDVEVLAGSVPGGEFGCCEKDIVHLVGCA